MLFIDWNLAFCLVPYPISYHEKSMSVEEVEMLTYRSAFTSKFILICIQKVDTRDNRLRFYLRYLRSYNQLTVLCIDEDRHTGQ